MRIRDFVADVNKILLELPKNESFYNLDVEQLKLLCWGATDLNLPVTKQNLAPFYDLLMKRSISLSKQAHPSSHYTAEADQVFSSVRALLERYLQPSVYDWPTMIAEMRKLPINQRVDYLSDFSLAKLSKIILNGSDFRGKVNDAKNYIGEEDHARTVLMTLGYYYYELTRTRFDGYKSNFAGWTGYDKAIKLKGINQILKFLESGRPLTDFESYLDSDRFSEVVANSMLKEYTLKDAVLQGELGDLCKMITFASKAENRELAHSKSWFSLR